MSQVGCIGVAASGASSSNSDPCESCRRSTAIGAGAGNGKADTAFCYSSSSIASAAGLSTEVRAGISRQPKDRACAGIGSGVCVGITRRSSSDRYIPRYTVVCTTEVGGAYAGIEAVMPSRSEAGR